MSKQKETATSKKVKVVGTEQYINQRTGQVEDFQVVRMEDRDFNFHKVWLESIINSMDLLGNQKTRLAFWIINNLDRENKLAYTQRQISEKSGISLKTVSVTMKALLDSNFLRRRNGGCYIVNPDILFKGTRNGRLNVLLQYQILDNTDTKDTKDTKVKPLRPEATPNATPAKVEESPKGTETPVCPECGERLELIEVGDLKGNFVCNECNSMFSPEEFKAS